MELTNDRKTLSAAYRDFFAMHYPTKGRTVPLQPNKKRRKLGKHPRRPRDLTGLTMRTITNRKHRGLNGTMISGLELRMRETALRGRMAVAQ